MEDSFFRQMDGETLRSLVSRTTLRDAALIMVGPTLHIERCSELAAALTELCPLERIDQLLSAPAVQALRDCIAQQTPRTVFEELDGKEYRLELLPHREGALLAFLRDDRASYDGSLRVLQAKGSQYLGAILSDAGQIAETQVAAHLRAQCLRLQRLLNHSDFLHDPPLTEQLRLQEIDLAALCRDVVNATARHTGQTIAIDAPETCPLLAEPQLLRTALYNLLTNAVKISPEGVRLQLRDDAVAPTVTVSDRGPGLDAMLFASLLDGWKSAISIEQYLSLARRGVTLGLGLPLTQLIAQLHGGQLLLSPRENGGSEMHFVLSHLPPALAETNLHAPMVLEDAFSVADLELSIL